MKGAFWCKGTGKEKNKSLPSENASDSALRTQDETSRCLKAILDSLGVEVKNQFSELRELENWLGFLCKTELLVKKNQINWKSDDQFIEFYQKCIDLVSLYLNDLKGSEPYKDFRDRISSFKRVK